MTREQVQEAGTLLQDDKLGLEAKALPSEAFEEEVGSKVTGQKFAI